MEDSGCQVKRGHLSSDGTRVSPARRATLAAASRAATDSRHSEQFSVALPWGFCLDFPGSDHYALIRSREDLKGVRPAAQGPQRRPHHEQPDAVQELRYGA